MKKMKKIGLLGAALLLFSACADFLDEKGYSTDTGILKTENGLEALVTGSYYGTRNLATSGNMTPGTMWEIIGTDIFTGGADGSDRNAWGWYQAQMNPVLGGAWQSLYSYIATCNLAISEVEETTVLRQEIKDVRLGELHFLRAYYYFFLLQQYGDLVLVTEPVTAPKTDYARVGQKEILVQIISDAQAAWEALPWADAQGAVTGDYGRASKGAAGFLLAQVYMYRYAQRWAGQGQPDGLNEDRGTESGDLQKVIYYAEQVCKFGAGAGSGSLHALAPNYADLWTWDPKTGFVGGNRGQNYQGSELLFAGLYSQDHFWNNENPSAVNNGGNWFHMMCTMFAEDGSWNLVTPGGGGGIDGADAPFGYNVNAQTGAIEKASIGLERDLITGRPWRRFVPTPYLYSDDGLFGRQAYTNGVPGKLQDSRIYKGFNWVYYANKTPQVKWRSWSNGAGSFDPASIGKVEGEPRYTEFGISNAKADTAILLSLENISGKYASGTEAEKLALEQAKHSYLYLPMQNIPTPTNQQQTGQRHVQTNIFPSLAKHLDSRRAGVNDQAGYRDLMLYRLAELYIVLSEAYALNGQFDLAAEALNVVRKRAAWKEDEKKYDHFYLFDGGDIADYTKSTENDMMVTAGFLSAMSESELQDFFLDEQGRECFGEPNRWSRLVRNGANFFLARVKAHNYLAAPNVQAYHRFRPIPQSHMDAIDPKRPEDQNPGYTSN